MRTEHFSGTIAGILIPVRSTHGTQAFAVYPAQRFHGKGQQNLLAKNVSDGQLRSGEERSPCVFFSQLDVVFVEQVFIALAKKQIESLLDLAS